ncbi:DUF1289 domain-containing protein [Methylobacter sp. YRD-M1]|uniref:DUF1289 domain-containing protein n=1 Tax=Methylobacter sp. YRD-M1 TaxID=2911520 RepID=UPI00227CD7BD|nr:DUF1289 domain-containing protein [Methylobacter sp. YRD-M1]WAK03539.1 DUF1289 domain-containing protein [Methylobacter sp. YRD-M1]
MNSAPKSILSPCIRQCCLNKDDICLGCFRSLEEIISWAKVDEETRQQFFKKAEIRRQLHKHNNHF